MHAIITTPGFIIDSRSQGEAGKYLSIFTRDLGLVRATAQGIRLEKSKLRYHVRDFSFGIFSLVRGKEVWRLTSAQELVEQKLLGADENYLSTHIRVELLARVALILKRLLHGEEPNPKLFEELILCRDCLASCILNEKQLATLESVTVVRILHALGYVGDDKEIEECFSIDLTTTLLDSLMAKRAIINQHINKALKESHL